MNNNSARITQYSKVSTSLACLSNEKLKQILADSKPMHEGIGGKSALICIDLAGALNNAPASINTIINRYAPIALIMDEFFQKLQKESKSTPYPATQLEKII